MYGIGLPPVSKLKVWGRTVNGRTRSRPLLTQSNLRVSTSIVLSHSFRSFSDAYYGYFLYPRFLVLSRPHWKSDVTFR